jgi:hypothetical protein
MANDCVHSMLMIPFIVGMVILIVGAINLQNDHEELRNQRQSVEVSTFMNVTQERCYEKLCENAELPRKQLSTKCTDVISNLGTYHPGDQIDCDNGFLCLEYQQMGPTTCYTLLMVNSSQLQCYNNYNCQLVSKTFGNIN